jgi:hypothetical protein
MIFSTSIGTLALAIIAYFVWIRSFGGVLVRGAAEPIVSTGVILFAFCAMAIIAPIVPGVRASIRSPAHKTTLYFSYPVIVLYTLIVATAVVSHFRVVSAA